MASETPARPLKLTPVVRFQGVHTDLTVRCGKRHWTVHKFVLCGQSKVFEMACRELFRENTQGEVNLDDDNVVAVRRMMQWFYCHDYNDSPRVPLNAFSAGAVVAASLHVNALVYAIADKYHIPGLKSLSVDKTYKLFQNVVDITVFIPAVKAVWNSTPSRDRGLRDLYIRFITTCRTQFQVHRGFMDLLRSDGALATELLTTSWDVLTSIQNGHAGVPAAENVGPRSS